MSDVLLFGVLTVVSMVTVFMPILVGIFDKEL